MTHSLSLLSTFTACLVLACAEPAAPEAPLPPSGLAGVGPSTSSPLALPGESAHAPAAQLPSGHPAVGDAMPPPVQPPRGESAQASAGVVRGTVVERIDASEYSYLKLSGVSAQPEWFAVPKADLVIGAAVSVSVDTVMTNFQSPKLQRTFDKLTMGRLVDERAANAPSGN